MQFNRTEGAIHTMGTNLDGADGSSIDIGPLDHRTGELALYDIERDGETRN
jgi:hypothetical protein